MDEVTATYDEIVATPAKPVAPWLKPAIGYGFAAAGLIWVLRDFQLGQLRGLIVNLDWRWIALAVPCQVTSYVCQGERWRLLLKPQGEISTLRTTQAIYAGLFTNEILPMRLGEIVRAYLASRWMSAPLSALIPSIMVERLFDSLWLAVGVGLTAIMVPLPGDLLRAADLLCVGVMIAASTLIGFTLRRQKTIDSSSGMRRAVSSLLGKLSGGLREMARTPGFYWSLAASLWLLIFQALAFWLILRGCGLHLGFLIGVAVFLIVHLGTAIPNAPANVGAYQFFTAVGLTLFSIDKSVATGVSIVVFAILTLPLLILGFIAISCSGTSLTKIRRETRNLIRR